MDTTASSDLLTMAYVIGSSRIEELLKNLSRTPTYIPTSLN
jgi:hypothetical protein